MCKNYPQHLVTLLALLLLTGAGCGDSAVSSTDAPPDSEEDVAALLAIGADFGRDESGRVTKVNLNMSRVSDADLSHLQGLPSLTYLELAYTKVTDAGLAELKELSGLEYLNLSHTQVADAGLTDLTGLSKLKWLSVEGTQVTSAGAGRLEAAIPGADVVR